MINKSILAVLIAYCLIQCATCCNPPDCDREDVGTCANACCTLEFYLDIEPSLLNAQLSYLMSSGGPDAHYTFVATEDLRPYNISAQFILQGIHTTFVQKYNDTLNFVIFPAQGTSFQSRLRAFSISQIHGAYGDDGQNYKNLVQLVKGLDLHYIEVHVSGCPPPYLLAKKKKTHSKLKQKLLTQN